MLSVKVSFSLLNATTVRCAVSGWKWCGEKRRKKWQAAVTVHTIFPFVDKVVLVLTFGPFLWTRGDLPLLFAEDCRAESPSINMRRMFD